MQPSIRFVTASDGVRIGYSVLGSGPPLVFVRGWVSHLEAMWELPRVRAFFTALAERFTVVRYDTRGQGTSETPRGSAVDLDSLLLDVEALIDSLDLNDIVLYGQTHGGPIAMAYAARHPYRVRRLILDGTYAKLYLPEPEAYESFVQTLETMWPHSISLIAQLTLPDPTGARTVDIREDFAARALTGEMAGRLYRLSGTVDVSHLLPSLAMPTLVVHRRGSRSISRRSARDLAADLPDASLVMLEGTAHNIWDETAQAGLDAIGRFLGVELELPEIDDDAARSRAPMAILFTDMEASTAMTSQLGDARAQDLVRTHDAVVRESLEANNGDEIKHTGDGIMAAFTSISAAVDCAIDIQVRLRKVETPFRVKVGIDAGEPLRTGRDLSGTVVQSARRIVDRAQPRQILVSEVVRRMVAGKNHKFVDRGRVTLKGIPERVRLFEVEWTSPATTGDA